jgi:outer membrane usher protein FimD/PapC
VPRLAFGVQTTRRLLLQAVTSTGHALPAGALVSDGEGALVTLVQADGTVFVPDAQGTKGLWVKAQGQEPCELQYELPAKADPDLYFETAAAVCRPS